MGFRVAGYINFDKFEGMKTGGKGLRTVYENKDPESPHKLCFLEKGGKFVPLNMKREGELFDSIPPRRSKEF